MSLSLHVRRGQFLPALRSLAPIIRAEYQPEVILSYEGGVLTTDIGGMAARMPAVGTWAGQARVNARFLQGIAANPPCDEPFVLEAVEGQLKVGTSSPRYCAPCSWQEPGRKPVQVPLNPEFADSAPFRTLIPAQSFH